MTGFTLEWYRELFTDKEIAKTLANSLKLAALSVGTAAVIGTAGAVALARKRMRLQGMMEGMAMLPAMVPEVVLGMAFLAAFTFVGLKLGLLTLYIAHTTFCIPYIFVLVRSRLASIDPQLEEAARDLGARRARFFRHHPAARAAGHRGRDAHGVRHVAGRCGDQLLCHRPRRADAAR